MTRGVNETLFDCWLSDDSFLPDLLAQVEWAHNLTEGMGILCEHYWENLYHETWTGANSHFAADGAEKLQMREREIHELIEKDAVSIGH